MTKQFTLAKKERLKSRKLIEQLFKEGKSLTISPYRIYYKAYTVTSTFPQGPNGQTLLPAEAAAQAGNPNPKLPRQETSNLRFGVGVSSKNFKRAVDRNRIKRLIKESYRLQKLSLHEKLKQKTIQLNVFFIYIDKELPEYKNVYEKMRVALERLIAEIDRTNQ